MKSTSLLLTGLCLLLTAPWSSAAPRALLQNPPGAPCMAKVQTGAVWAVGDGTYMGNINVWLMNLGSTDIPTPWQFTITNPNYLGLTSMWNSQLSGMDTSTGTVTGSVHESWEGMKANSGNEVNIGATFHGSSPQNFYPRAIFVDGVQCAIQQMR